MRDVEILIRFLAFSETIQYYNGNLRDFLDRICKQFNSEWGSRETEIKRLAAECDYAIDSTFRIFESRAFRRVRTEDFIRKKI